MSYLIEQAVIVAETEDAICVLAPEFDEDTWIPSRQVHDDFPIYRDGEEGDLLVKDWWAERQGWL